MYLWSLAHNLVALLRITHCCGRHFPRLGPDAGLQGVRLSVLLAIAKHPPFAVAGRL